MVHLVFAHDFLLQRQCVGEFHSPAMPKRAVNDQESLAGEPADSPASRIPLRLLIFASLPGSRSVRRLPASAGGSARSRARQPHLHRVFRLTREGAHHKGNLVFVGRAASDGRLFDSPRRIFKNRKSVFRRGENGRAARRAEQNRGLVTLHVNDGFERATVRFVFPKIDSASRSRIATRQDEDFIELAL